MKNILQQKEIKWVILFFKMTSRVGILCIFFVFLFIFELTAQRIEYSSRVWHNGTIVLDSDDTLRGAVKYDLDNNILQVARGQNAESISDIRTYSARKVFYYSFTDGVTGNFREFYSIPYFVRANYKTPIFFEVLHEGGLTLLGREKIVVEQIPQNSFNNFGGVSTRYITRERLGYDYFFLHSNGKIDRYTEKKKDLLYILSRRDNEIEDYIKINRLEYDERDDLVKIVEYYNTIEE